MRICSISSFDLSTIPIESRCLAALFAKRARRDLNIGTAAKTVIVHGIIGIINPRAILLPYDRPRINWDNLQLSQ